jgi:hypothetical protein
MPHDQDQRHPFLDDLTTDAELISSVLRGPVVGRDEIRLVVNTSEPSTRHRRTRFFRLSARGCFSNTGLF